MMFVYELKFLHLNVALVCLHWFWFIDVCDFCPVFNKCLEAS